MSKLQQITADLEQRLPLLNVKKEQFESWQEDGTLEPGGRQETEQGVHLLDWKYRAVLCFERIPARHAGLLLAFVQAWLDDHDPDREDRPLPAPEGQIDMDDKHNLADVEITVDFIDPVYVVEDDNGLIDWDGRKWTFGDYDLWIAEAAVVGHGADLQEPTP